MSCLFGEYFLEAVKDWLFYFSMPLRVAVSAYMLLSNIDLLCDKILVENHELNELLLETEFPGDFRFLTVLCASIVLAISQIFPPIPILTLFRLFPRFCLI